MTKPVIHILLVEGSATDALLLEYELAESSFGPFLLTHVTSLQEAFIQLRVQRFDVLLVDVGFSANQGPSMLEQIHQYDPQIPVVVLTERSEELLGIKALQEGAEDYVVKSGSRDTLRDIYYAIERKRSNEARIAATQQLALAVDAAELSIYEWNINSGQITWAFRRPSLFGLRPDAFPGTLKAFRGCAHPEDRAGIDRAIHQAIAKRTDFLYQFRVLWNNGSVHWLEGRGKVVEDERGVPVRMIGTVIDITQKKAASQIELTRVKESVRLSEAKLTPREHTLLKLIASGLPNKRIALDLNISIRTVAKHRSHLMAKTKALNAADLARMTTIAGLFTAE